MALKVAINGFGRIGRCVARIALSRDDIELVAINDTTKIELSKYLFQYDSVHGIFDKKIEIINDSLIKVDNKEIKFFSTRDVNELDFAGCGAEVVLECTGAHLTTQKCEPYLKNGIKKVIMSAPAKDDETKTFVLGVNEEKYAGENIISNASCTTNCLGPITRILEDKFEIISGLMTTIHAYTHGQSLVDSKSRDFRRSRAAACNIIPTTTGAAKAMKKVIPSLDGKLHGQSVRVPVPNVSMVDLTASLKKNTSIEELNEIFRFYANDKMKGILCVDDDYKVSSDLMGNPYSSIIASDLTQVINGNFIKVMSWYDNEWGYSNRLLDLAKFISK